MIPHRFVVSFWDICISGFIYLFLIITISEQRLTERYSETIEYFYPFRIKLIQKISFSKQIYPYTSVINASRAEEKNRSTKLHAHGTNRVTRDAANSRSVRSRRVLFSAFTRLARFLLISARRNGVRHLGGRGYFN